MAPMMGAVSAHVMVLTAVLVAVILGVVVFEIGTETRTMTISFSYDKSSKAYFASASLPVGIKSAKLHAQFSISAVPKISLRIVSSDGTPLQLVQGNLNFDSSFGTDISAWCQNLGGKPLNFYLAFDPNLPTVSLPYLEVAYAVL
jgi:hypothetical protein